MTKVLTYNGKLVEVIDLGPVLYWCYKSNDEWFVHKPGGSVRCKDFREASKMLHELRSNNQKPYKYLKIIL